MSVAAVAMCRNEVDVAAFVVRHMLAECDRVIVADNRSDDGTRELLDAITDRRLVVLDEPRFEYYQADTMNRLAEAAEADWIVPFDFDEWWTADLLGRGDRRGRVADTLTSMPDGVDIVPARTFDCVPQPTDDPDELDPFRRVRHFRPGSPWSRPGWQKVAYRWAPGRRLMMGNHGVVGLSTPATPGPLTIYHVPFRTFDQAAAKLRHGRAALAAATDVPLAAGAHWREWGGLDDDGLARWWIEWTDPVGLVRLP